MPKRKVEIRKMKIVLKKKRRRMIAMKVLTRDMFLFVMVNIIIYFLKKKLDEISSKWDREKLSKK